MFDPALQTAIQQLKPPLLEMWTRYFSLGGNLDVTAVDVYLIGLVDIADLDHDILAQALNELYLDRGQDHPLVYHRA